MGPANTAGGEPLVLTSLYNTSSCMRSNRVQRRCRLGGQAHELRFWAVEDAVLQQLEFSLFFKNIAIAGGLLAVARPT